MAPRAPITRQRAPRRPPRARRDDQLRRELQRVLDAVAVSLPGGIHPGCRGYVTEFIDLGVKGMMAKGARDDSSLMRARGNLLRFLGHMVAQAAEQGQDWLSEDTFFFAKKLCPGFWPFC
jgi:hypothetical protein